jgi:CDGSH-type Zn-finger protein
LNEMEDKRDFKSQATIEVIDSGPIKITGNILITDSKRDITEKPAEVWLCRCGRSQNKPYCDESHKK